MFYSKFILSSSGALSAVWQAAHWEVNKVKRPMVNETQIDVCACSTGVKMSNVFDGSESCIFHMHVPHLAHARASFHSR